MNDRQLRASGPPCALAILALSMMLPSLAQAAPVGGVVAAGAASIAVNGTRTTVTQGTPAAVINWQGFGIAAGEAVHFQQPGSSSVMLNRVVGPDPSAIFGNLSANGKVFLVNPGGVLFGPGASVNVGGLVASTLDIADGDFMRGHYAFTGTGRASVVNQGTINADGSYVALLGTTVVNDGAISARLGNVTLAAGEAVTLDVLGDQLLQVRVDRAAVDALASNGGLLQADGGQVLMTTQAAGSLLSTAVNNTGVVQAQTISSRNGTIRLMGTMVNGTLDLSGRLDASAPNGGDGGAIETSAARVRVHDGAQVTTLAALGRTGEWLIDPEDFTIGSGATANISGATLSALLVTNSVVIMTAPGPDATVAGTPPVTTLGTAVIGNGDIHVNEAVSWTAAPNTTTLTLNASRDVNINQAITATNGNLVVCCGRDVNVSAAITTTNGSVLLAAGRDVNLSTAAAMTTTDGNMMICANNDIGIASALTLTRGSSIPAQSLGLPTGMTLSAGLGGTGPGVDGGTVQFAPLAPTATVTGPNAAVTVNYNPPGYTTPTDFSGEFSLTLGASLTQRMLVFGVASKPVDGTTAVVLSGLKGNPAGVTLVAGPASAANFDNAVVGTNKPVTFSGYTLGGPDAARYALPIACCGPAIGRTTGSILAVAVVPPVQVPVQPPVIVPVPVPVPIVPPPIVLVPDVETPVGAAESVMPQFAPFVVAPALLGTVPPSLVVAPSATAPMELVLVQAPVIEAAPPAPVAAPVAPVQAAPAAPAAPVLLPKPYRN
jgi:filamentous hemagglutinin family protein